MKSPRVVFSINAYHQKVLEIVIESCERIMQEDFVIIVNCSKGLYEKISNQSWKSKYKNAILNEDHFNKERFTGTIAKGVISNMKLANKLFHEFEYFFILSNRTILWENPTSDLLQKCNKLNSSAKDSFESILDSQDPPHPLRGKPKGKTAEYLRDHAKNIWKVLKSKSPLWYHHEGSYVSKNLCNTFLDFLKENEKIESEISSIPRGSGFAPEEIVLPSLLGYLQNKGAGRAATCILSLDKKKHCPIEHFRLVAHEDGDILYDLKNDPDELINVIDKHPEIAKRLRLKEGRL